MKTLVFLILILSFNVFPMTSVKDNLLPVDVQAGETIQNVEKNFPTYHFKFYKIFETEFGESLTKMTFSMLGYWDKGEGCVLVFTNDTLIATNKFTNIKDYKEYITGSDNEWKVHAEDGEVLGTHTTKSDAEKQLQAIEINKHKETVVFTRANNQDMWVVN